MPIVRKAAGVALGAREVVRDLGRLQEIVKVLARHGLGWVVARVEVPGIGLLRRIAEDPSPQQPTPERVCAIIRELGPTFVKLGQVLSTREDLIPRNYIEAFQSLQDDVDPFSFDEVVTQFADSFNQGPHDLFDDFEEQPLAAASIAQVHRARRKDGRSVAVKVQRPGIRTKIHTDLSILEFLGRSIQAQIPEAQVLDLPGALRVLRESITRETDFRQEARATQRFADNFRDDEWVVIPEVHTDLVTADILTLEFIDGVKIGEAREAGFDMQLVGQRYLGASFQMLLQDGWFHCDLHPGNVLVLPDGRLGLLDFGMTARLTAEMQENLVDVFFAVQRRDYRTIARVYWELAIKPEKVNYPTWEADVQEVMENHITGQTMGEIKIADFLRDLLSRAHRHRVLTSPEYTMFFKALITTEGLAKMLIPEVDPLEEMAPYVERMVRRQYGSDRLKDELFHFLTSFRYTARRLPLLSAQLISDLQEGRLRVRSVMEHSDDDRKRLSLHSNRLVLSLVFCGLVVGSSLGLGADTPKLLGMPAPATVGYIIAGVLLARILRAVRKSGGA